jgi:hypothetical protein
MAIQDANSGKVKGESFFLKRRKNNFVRACFTSLRIPLLKMVKKIKLSKNTWLYITTACLMVMET